MSVYEIKGNEVNLFPIRYVTSIFGTTREAITMKEYRGQLSKANFRSPSGKQRLYSIEDLAVIEYIYKEVWPMKNGVKVPDWVKEMVKDALAQSKVLVVQKGGATSPDDWDAIHQKFGSFDKYRLQVYLDSWRSRLLDDSKFFPELVDEDEV